LNATTSTGNVHGRDHEPGPSQRTVVDLGRQATILASVKSDSNTKHSDCQAWMLRLAYRKMSFEEPWASTRISVSGPNWSCEAVHPVFVESSNDCSEA